MTKTRIIANLLLLFMIMLMLAGCREDDQKGSPQVSSEKPTPTSFLDYLHEAIPPGSLISHELDNGTLSEEEYHLRCVINSLSMYKEVTGQEYDVEMYNVKKYGIDEFSRYDDWYHFDRIDDMATVFNNLEFQQDFYDQYGFDLEFDAYYLPPISTIEKYNIETGPINLVVWDKDFYLGIDGGGYKDDAYLYYDEYFTRGEVDLKALLEFYAGIDGSELNSAISGDGTRVYYTTTETGSVFFEDIGIQTTVPITAYIWKQGDAIIIMVLEGEFDEGNLELCTFERHEL